MSRVLIVEDETIVADSLHQFLHHAGHEVVGVARDEASALKAAIQGKPEVVLMDIKLANGSDGIEAARKMQARSPVMVVFMSAFHDPKTRARAASVKPAGFIPKPFLPQDLVEAVALACGNARHDDL